MSSRSSFFNYDSSISRISSPDINNIDSCFKSEEILIFNLVFPYSGNSFKLNIYWKKFAFVWLLYEFLAIVKKFEIEYQEFLDKQIQGKILKF